MTHAESHQLIRPPGMPPTDCAGELMPQLQVEDMVIDPDQYDPRTRSTPMRARTVVVHECSECRRVISIAEGVVLNDYSSEELAPASRCDWEPLGPHGVPTEQATGNALEDWRMGR